MVLKGNRRPLMNGHRRAVEQLWERMRRFQGGRGLSKWDWAPQLPVPCYCWVHRWSMSWQVDRKPHTGKSWSLHTEHELGHLWFESLTPRAYLDITGHSLLSNEGDHLLAMQCMIHLFLSLYWDFILKFSLGSEHIHWPERALSLDSHPEFAL